MSETIQQENTPETGGAVNAAPDYTGLPTVNRLLQERLQAENAERRRKREAESAAQEERERRLRATLGEALWSELAPVRDGDKWVVEAEGLLPFRIYVTSSHSLRFEGGCGSVDVASFNDRTVLDEARCLEKTGDFLLQARVQWEKNRERVNAEKAGHIRSRLWHGGEIEEAEAARLMAEVERLAPDAEHNAQAFAKYYEARARHLESLRRAAERKTLRGQAIAAYKKDFQRAYPTFRAALLANRARVRPLAEALDGPHTMFRLTYAYVADNEGEAYVGTETVITPDERSDGRGYWSVYRWESVALVQYRHVVSVEQAENWRWSEAREGRVQMDVEDAGGFKIYFGAHLTKEAVREMIRQAGVEPLPPLPGIVDVEALGTSDLTTIQHNAVWEYLHREGLEPTEVDRKFFIIPAGSEDNYHSDPYGED